jgi:16S rRNA (guanine966-N2)-methyltransferase
MRIVGGIHRSRQLKMVGKPTTRETADMVRESVFNMLGGTVRGVVLDLFSGSGAYALEAISRGASYAHTVDLSKDAIKTIQENAKLLKEDHRVTIYHKDYEQFLTSLTIDQKFDLVFLDPPYEMNIYEHVMDLLSSHTFEDSRIICESKKQLELPDTIGSFVKIKDKSYGIKRISIYEKEAQAH